jgi:hypothetical protein
MAVPVPVPHEVSGEHAVVHLHEFAQAMLPHAPTAPLHAASQ